jgi:PEGA domain-containing protein
MQRSTLSTLWIAALLAAVPALRAQTVSKASHGAKPADSFLTGAPFTLDQVIKVIGQDAIPLRRRKEAIQNRGVDFSMTEDAVARLKAAGASEEVLDLIKSKARPAPPPPEPPKLPAVGSIGVTCEPAECEISVNGAPRGSTTGGALTLDGLAPGSYTIDFSRPGYVSRQDSVAVVADGTAPLAATLEPTRETQETFGAALFQKMLQALGGEQGLNALATLQATGSATILTSDGRSIRWTLRMRTRTGHALFQAKAGVVEHEVLFTGNEFTASKSLKGQDALDLPTAFGIIRDNEVVALMSRLNKQQYKMLAGQAEPVAGAESALIAEGGTDKISIGLDADLRPQRVQITTETGIGSLLITYSSYSQVGQAWYPKSMQVKAEGKQHGAEVRFDTVEQDTKSKDSDFKLKNKVFANFYN